MNKKQICAAAVGLLIAFAALKTPGLFAGSAPDKDAKSDKTAVTLNTGDADWSEDDTRADESETMTVLSTQTVKAKSLFGAMCVSMANASKQTIYWRATWVADHSFGWDPIKGRSIDVTCRHYGGTIFNNIQIKDSAGKIYKASPWTITSPPPQYNSYVFDGTKVQQCGGSRFSELSYKRKYCSK